MKIEFLGGLREFGKNCLKVGEGSDSFLIDCGMKFPNTRDFGIDYETVDVSGFTGQDVDVLITHGHEDHIGGLAHLADVSKSVRIYGTALSLEIASRRLAETRATNVELVPVEYRTKLHFGSLSAEFVRITHSIPEAAAILVRSESVSMLHTGDFRLDPFPQLGKATDLAYLTSLHQNGGIDFVLPDSTRAEVSAATASEATVARSLKSAIGTASGRVLVGLFGSHIERMSSVIQIARELGLPWYAVGRSVEKNLLAAQNHGVIGSLSDRCATDKAVAEVPGVVLMTGSQGEENAALAKFAAGSSHLGQPHPSDTVILSSKPIPGNEVSVNELRQCLMQLGVTVVTTATAEVHTSGHASADDLFAFFRALKPNCVIPLHGDFSAMRACLQIAREAGINGSLFRNGDAVELLSGGAAKLVEKGEEGPGKLCMVDARSWDVGDDLLRERHDVARNGVVFVSIAVSDVGIEVKCDSRGWTGESMAEISQIVVAWWGAQEKDDRNARQLKAFLYRKFGMRRSNHPVFLVHAI